MVQGTLPASPDAGDHSCPVDDVAAAVQLQRRDHRGQSHAKAAASGVLASVASEAGLGLVRAQYTLGSLYSSGKVLPKDFGQAIYWYRQAAEQGFSLAQYSMARRYYTGEGVPKDYALVVAWSRKAAEQGHAGAQNYLGVRYELGEGVAQDYAQALRWYGLAAEQGDATAQNNLGVL